MNEPINWDDVKRWGVAGSNVHHASSGNYGPDAGHDDITEDQ